MTTYIELYQIEQITHRDLNVTALTLRRGSCVITNPWSAPYHPVFQVVEGHSTTTLTIPKELLSVAKIIRPNLKPSSIESQDIYLSKSNNPSNISIEYLFSDRKYRLDLSTRLD